MTVASPLPRKAEQMPPKRRAWALLLGLVAAVWGGEAKAYVLPGRVVLDRYIRSLGGETCLRIRQKGRIRIKAQSPEAVVVDETVYYRFPGMFRSDAVSGPVKRIHLQVGDAALTVLDQRIVPAAKNPFDRYKDLLLCRSRRDLETLLARHGINPDICTLGRFEGAVVYVIGARYPDESKPQLAIDKEHFWPVRWVFAEDANGSPAERMEIRYGNWTQTGTTWYPWRVAFYQNGEPAETIEVKDLQVNPSFPPALFDMATLKSMYARKKDGDAASPKGDGVSEEIEKTIEEFKKMYE